VKTKDPELPRARRMLLWRWRHK